MRRIRRFLFATLALSALLPAAATATPDLTRTDPDIERPLKWLVSAQNDNGGWGADIKSPPDVATTAISGISLIRLGHTMAAGQYQSSTRKAIGYVVAAVEKTPKEEIAINEPGTLPQRKLGRYIDTFLGAQLLSEALPSMPAGKERDRVKAALARLADESFIRGFGSYGGEEHVSYMMTSEALATIGGKDFERWDRGIRLRLAHIQRDNGTWRGDHCITSTSFCTAASLITLMVRPHPQKGSAAHQI